MSENRSSNNLHFPALDILRGFAAISVLTYHVIEHWGWKEFPVSGLAAWFRAGWMGVDLFFVMSGFVIGLSAFSGIDAHGKNFRYGFMKRRLFRIIPLHYFSLLVFFVFITPALLFENFWVNLATHLTFTHNLSSRFHGAVNGVNWSLAVEMQFYILMLCVSPWLLRTRPLAVILLSFGISWAWRYGVTIFLPFNENGAFPMFVAVTQLPGMLDEFAVGVLLAMFIRGKAGSAFLLDVIEWRFGRLVICAVSAVLLYFTLSLYWLHATYWDNALMVVMFRSALGLSFGFLVFAACALQFRGRVKVLVAPFCYLGTISYGIYLWHLPVLLSLKRVQWLSAEAALLLTICITLIISSISWHFFERPIMQRLSGR